MANDYLCPEKHIQIKLTITQKGLYKFQLTLGSLSKSVRSSWNLYDHITSRDMIHVGQVLTWLANIGRSFYAWKHRLVLSFVYLNIQYWWIESLRKRTYISSRFWCFKSDKSAIFELIFERFGPLNFWLLTNDLVKFCKVGCVLPMVLPIPPLVEFFSVRRFHR